AVWIDTGSVVRADAASPRGWQAPCYNQRQPALSLACEAESKVACFCTLFGPGECSLTLDGEHMQVLATGWQADIRLGNVQRPETPLIQRVDFSGQCSDRLEIA